MTCLWIILYIVLAIAALITLLMFVRAGIIIEYRDSLSVVLKVLFVKKQLYPEVLTRIRVGDYSENKLKKKQRRAQKKAEKQTVKTKNKKTKTESQTKNKRSFSEILDLINTVKQIVSVLVKAFFGYLRIDVSRVNIIVACGEADKTAIVYGAVYQAVSYLLAVLDGVTNVKYQKTSEVSVSADFTADSFSADIKIAFSIRVGQAIKVMIKTAYNYLKTKNTVGRSD